MNPRGSGWCAGTADAVSPPRGPAVGTSGEPGPNDHRLALSPTLSEALPRDRHEHRDTLDPGNDRVSAELKSYS